MCYSTHCVQEGCSTCRARITVGPLIQVTNMQQPFCCVSGSLGSLKWGHREWKSQMLPSDFPSPLDVQPHGHQWRPWSRPSKNHTVCPEETSHSREKCWLHKDWANPAANGCLETTSYQMKTVLIQYSLKHPQSLKCLLCQGQTIQNGSFAVKLFGGITNISHGLCSCLHSTKWSQKCQHLMLREKKKRNHVLTKGLRLCFPEERQSRQSCLGWPRWQLKPLPEEAANQTSNTQKSTPLGSICSGPGCMPGAEQLSSSGVCLHGSQSTNKGVWLHLSQLHICWPKGRPWWAAHRSQHSSALQCFLRCAYVVTHTSHQNSWIATSLWSAHPNVTQPHQKRLQSLFCHHCGHNPYGRKQSGGYAITN